MYFLIYYQLLIILKSYLAKNTELLSNNQNVEQDDSDEWLNLDFSQTVQNDNKENEYDEDYNLEFGEVSDSIAAECDIDELTEDALEYLAGYVINKLNLSDEIAKESTFTYVDEVSHGGLIKPSSTFKDQIKQLEIIFLHIVKDKFSITNNLKYVLLKAAEQVNVKLHIKKFYFKIRIYFRIKNLNKRIFLQKQKQKIMSNSKLIKIKL